MTACPAVKALRSKCYNLGVQQKSFAAEQDCLCSPDTAYQVTQCFAKNYRTMTDESQKANYYEDFLTYTYDCWCGVDPIDVTYNRTANPVTPYIPGYTGDAILPPVGGCPEKPTTGGGGGGGGTVCPIPPCGCPPPQKPPKASCPSGYKRVYDTCVPECPPAPECDDPKVVDSRGQCICPYGTLPIGPTGCAYPDCPDPNDFRVITPRGSYCTCKPGYEYDSSNRCVLICGPGQVRDSYGTCQDPCTPPSLVDYQGNC